MTMPFTQVRVAGFLSFNPLSLFTYGVLRILSSGIEDSVLDHNYCTKPFAGPPRCFAPSESLTTILCSKLRN